MSFEKINGIVLKYVNYKDSDKILSVLTRERGIVSLNARGCMRMNSMIASVCDVMCMAEFVIYRRSGIDYISSASLIDSFYSIREDYDSFVAAMKVLELTSVAASSDEPWDELFILCCHTLTFLAYSEANPNDLELCFLAKLLKISGYEPTLTRCVKCGVDLRRQREIRFSEDAGGAVCEHCGEGKKVFSALSLEALRRMLRLPVERMDKAVLPSKVREELGILLHDYAEAVFERRFIK